MDYGLLTDPGINAAVQHFSAPLTSFFVQLLFLDTMPWYFLVISVITFGLHPRYGSGSPRFLGSTTASTKR